MLAELAVLMAAGQMASPDPLSAFVRVRERLFADTARLPRYTCVQTIRRSYYQPTMNELRQRGCDAILGARIRRKYDLPLVWTDALRLDVAVASGREIHSWAGAHRFDDRDLDDLVNWGPTGTGDFRGFVQAIFGPESTVGFEGDAEEGGKKLLEYSYTVPRERSRYEVRTSGARVITGYAGAIRLDTEANDLASLTVVSDELPEETELCQATLAVDYHRVRILDDDVPVPAQTRLRMVRRDGTETENVTSYSNCRAYTSNSVMRFDGAEVAVPAAPARKSALAPAPFPAGLQFKARINTPIDENSAAGDPVEAVLIAAIEDRRGIALAPSGAAIRGRIARVTHHFGANERFELGVRFESILLDGVEVPFTAGTAQVMAKGAAAGRLKIRSKLKFPADIQTNVGTFVFPGARLKVAGLDGTWQTTEPLPPPKRPVSE